MIEDYLNQSATVSTPSSYNDYGEPVYNTSTISCRLEFGSGWTKNADGQDVLYEGRLFSIVNPPSTGLITFEGDDYQIVNVDTVVGFDGDVSHYETLLGKSGGR